MPWGRIDDTLYDHPKLQRLGRNRLAAVGLNTLAISWCNRFLTDGHVPAAQVRRLGASPALAEELVEAELWEHDEADGYVIHDFLEYSDSKVQVLSKRDAAKKRMQARRSREHDEDGSREQPANVRENNTRTTSERSREVRDSRVRAGVGARRPGRGPGPSRPVHESESLAPAAESARDRQQGPTKAAGATNGVTGATGAAGATGATGATITSAQHARWADFSDPSWAPFKSAWIERGFHEPPTGGPDDDPRTSQRAVLWPIADARPRSLAQWVAEAPGRTPREVIDHVIRQWRKVEAEVAEPVSQVSQDVFR